MLMIQSLHNLTRRCSLLAAACRRVPLEAYIWTVGLGALACTDPTAESVIEGCLSRLLFDMPCPGCGLGHAVSYLFRGEVVSSLQAHPLGLPAVLILVGRTGRLVWETFAHPMPPFQHT